MPDYRDNDLRGWGGDPRRGAALGRPTLMGDYDGLPLTLRLVVIDSDGYDPLGTYFGRGQPLWWCASQNGAIDFVLRASDLEAAKAEVRSRVKGARFG
jgi:hypothetical protein